MAKYNRPVQRQAAQGFMGNYVSELVPVYQPTPVPNTRTHEGAPAFTRDSKSELFLLAVTGFLGDEGSFYESAESRDQRFVSLIEMTTLTDPVWAAQFLMWLRHVANIRTASTMGAVHFAQVVARYPELTAKLQAVELSARKVVKSVLVRADEPGEMLAYAGRNPTWPIRKGIADAVLRLYNERNWLKWDSTAAGFRFADVIDQVHPATTVGWQGDLFQHILDTRHGHSESVPRSLGTLVANEHLRSWVSKSPQALLDPSLVAQAGMTWEDVLSLGGQHKLDKAALWESIIPSMDYMALLRNLRNFDEAGISPSTVRYVQSFLSNPNEVAHSRQFPYRFWSAYKNVSSDRWREPLGIGLQYSMSNIPKLSGRSLVLIDLSGSMQQPMSTGTRRRVAGYGIVDQFGRTVRNGGSTMARNEAAAVFGVTLGLALGADVRIFGTRSAPHEMHVGASPLREVERLMRRDGECGHGTHIAEALTAGYRAHDRVFIISDMQTMGAGISNQIPGSVPMYGFDLAGYVANPMALGPNRVQLGGLTDATFKMVPLIEAGQTASWPWE